MKPKTMKPVKGWAVVDEDGINPDLTYRYRSHAAIDLRTDERVVRVELRELKPKKRGKK